MITISTIVLHNVNNNNNMHFASFTRIRVSFLIVRKKRSILKLNGITFLHRNTLKSLEKEFSHIYIILYHRKKKKSTSDHI